MKKFCLLMAFAWVLCGCSAAPTFETVGDDHVQSAMQEERGVLLTIPEEAAAQQIRGDAGVIYLCDGFEVAAQVMAAGDLNRTFRTMTGFESDSLTVMATSGMDYTRYECVWTAVGEGGDTVGRAVILDDGVYHYCLTVTADADAALQQQEVWKQIIDSYHLA